MKAIQIERFGGPEVLQMKDLPDPVPGPGQAVIRVMAAGVNPADTYVRCGTYSFKPPLPFIPGFDCAGLVESAGPGSRLTPGGRVYAAFAPGGAYAEKALVEEARVHPLPKRLSFAQGAAIGVAYATAHRALFHRARAAAGETVLVHGASGGVGLAAVQLARRAGLVVWGSAGTEEGRRLAAANGAHRVLDHGAAGYLDEIQGVDVIVEMLANVNLDRDLRALAPGGRVVVVGSRGRVEIDPRAAMTRDGAILGMSLWNASLEEQAAIHKALAPGFADGSLTPAAGRSFPLSEAARAHTAVLEPGALGRLVLIP
jgi:NADPH2:quinone reductase